MRRHHLFLGAVLLGIGSAATADDQTICADRPSKSTGPCTVPQGKWQIETGLVDWTRDRSGGLKTDTIVWANTAIKYGIGRRTDLELWITPLETASVHGGGESEHHSSFGDTVLRIKYALTSDDAPVQVALDPFVKIPTANHRLGNGKVEGGLLVPIEIPIGKSPITLSLDPEVDLFANSDGSGHHLAADNVVNLGLAVNDRVTVSTEVWTMWDWDPAGTGKQASWDVAGSYLATKALQLDVGANFGLNNQTPDFEVYSGVSVRF